MIIKEEIEEVKKFINNILIKHDWFDNAYLLAGNAKTLIMYMQQLETKEQKVIDKLEHDNEIDNIAVKKLEEKRRTATSDYYKNSYQMQIHKLNAKIEARKEILKIMKGEE